MKNLLKITLGIALFAIISFSANAQTSSGELTASASVFDEIKVNAIDPLLIGQVQKGTTKSIGFTNNVLAGSTSVSSFGIGTGKFSVLAGAGSNVDLAITHTALTFTENDVTNSLTFLLTDGPEVGAAQLVSWGTTEVANSPTPFVAGKINVAGGTFPTNPIGDNNGIYVYVGGHVNALANQPSGSYSGTVTLTATYN